MTVNRQPIVSFGSGRIIGAIWVICIVSGIYGILVVRGTMLGQDALLISGGAYIAVSALLYEVFRPANPSGSLVAAFFGLMAVIEIFASGDTSFFGAIQCLLLGYLIWISRFLPRAIGALIAIAGVGQLIFLSTLLPAALTKPLAPIGYISDGIGEVALALWLLVMGVNTMQWKRAARDQAEAVASSTA